jgi:hypothetical protein
MCRQGQRFVFFLEVAMTTVSAFEALVFGLLPIHGMPGKVLFKYRRWLWPIIGGLGSGFLRDEAYGRMLGAELDVGHAQGKSAEILYFA